MLKYEDGPSSDFPEPDEIGYHGFPVVPGQRLYRNFKAKRLCQTRLNIWRNRTMLPWVQGTSAKLWNQDQLFKKLSVQNPWDISVRFPHVWKGKTETRAGGALIQGYNISTLCWKFKITSKGPPASKWVTVTQEPNTVLIRGETFQSVILSHQKNPGDLKGKLPSFCPFAAIDWGRVSMPYRVSRETTVLDLFLKGVVARIKTHNLCERMEKANFTHFSLES